MPCLPVSANGGVKAERAIVPQPSSLLKLSSTEMHLFQIPLLLIPLGLAGPHVGTGIAATGGDTAEPATAQELPVANLFTTATKPDPGLSPADVVRIQIESLRINGLSDNGIYTTYRFASPSNKRVTGPYERFAQMIKSPPYRAMLNARTIAYGNIRISDTRAIQEVRLTGADGINITYIFFLRRQSDAPFEGCWMTEAVIAKPAEGNPDYNLGPPGVG